MRLPACLALSALLGSGIAPALAKDPVAPSPNAPAAAPDPDRKPVSWAEVDKNGDGAIDRSEATAGSQLAARFNTRDTNRDGRLTRDEYFLP